MKLSLFLLRRTDLNLKYDLGFCIGPLLIAVSVKYFKVFLALLGTSEGIFLDKETL